MKGMMCEDESVKRNPIRRCLLNPEGMVGEVAEREIRTSTTADVVAYGTSSSKLRGVALDPGTLGQLMRVILLGGAKSLS